MVFQVTCSNLICKFTHINKTSVKFVNSNTMQKYSSLIWDILMTAWCWESWVTDTEVSCIQFVTVRWILKFTELLPCCHCKSRYPQHPNNKEFWQIESQYTALILRTKEHSNKAMNKENIFMEVNIHVGLYTHNKHTLYDWRLCTWWV